MSLQSRWTMGFVIVWECNKRFLSNTQGKNRYKYGEKNAQCFEGKEMHTTKVFIFEDFMWSDLNF